jgi:hypothetical protein
MSYLAIRVFIKIAIFFPFMHQRPDFIKTGFYIALKNPLR